MLPIETERDRHVVDADFGIHVDRGHMRVPLEVGEVLEKMNIRNAEQFVSYLLTYPSPFLSQLHWDRDQFFLARDRALEELKGHVAPELLEHDATFQRGYGAMPPSRRGAGH